MIIWFNKVTFIKNNKNHYIDYEIPFLSRSSKSCVLSVKIRSRFKASSVSFSNILPFCLGICNKIG